MKIPNTEQRLKNNFKTSSFACNYGNTIVNTEFFSIFSKSLASMRQKLRKYLKDFEDDIAKFRENPDQPDDDEEEEKSITLKTY